ncbi:MAG: ABC-F family ATP-binding cassette domain-containing protein [Chloroflexota bacterium]
MSVVSGHNLAKSYGAQDIFADVSFQLAHGDKVALVGPNGEGKTTLLRIIAGLETPTEGAIHRMKGLRMGYLPQMGGLSGGRSLWAEMLSVFEHLLAQQQQLRRLEEVMAGPSSQETLARYDRLLLEFEMAGGYEFELRIQKVLSGLGFTPQRFHYPLEMLSGGQQTRALLARLLLEEPDLLLLDEPTNHLDVDALEWLEEYLVGWPKSLIVVAHDRYFLDKVVNRVWDLAFGQLEAYPGNYSEYVQLRGERMARRAAEYKAQQRHIAREEDFIQRYMAGQRTREAQGRARRLTRLERLERPRQTKHIHLRMAAVQRSGEIVLRTEGLRVGYAAHLSSTGHEVSLFATPDLELRRLERAALIGPNGSGKTTLLKTILGDLPPLAGGVQLGANVVVGYLAQAHADLDTQQTVLDAVLDAADLSVAEARDFLGRFLFSGDDVFKQVADLSGGERSRVALARLTLQGANLLVLDEPTNHLDIASQEILEDVLAEFNGTVLLVSHDRYLIRALATQMWALEGDRLQVYQGDYDSYLQQKQAARQPEPAAAPRPAHPTQAAERARRRQQERHARRVAQIEIEIAGLEERLVSLSGALTAASAAQQLDRLQTLGVEYTQTERALERLLAEWESIAETVEV